MSKPPYPIDQSPLYGIRGKGQLERVLRIEIGDLDDLLAIDSYRTFHIAQGAKTREIQTPIKALERVHKRIAALLSRIEVPDYLSSKKGSSYVDNARLHVNSHPLGKTDIQKFYPSTTHRMVRTMFTEQFKCAGDIALILANLCCYKQEHLPTGSTISGYIAFFCAKPMFDEIKRFSDAKGCTFSVYVDDITLSGPGVSKSLIAEVRAIVRQHGLRTKQSKSKTFPADAPKIVTGTVVTKDSLRLPNARHKKLHEARLAVINATPDERPKLALSLAGRMQEARQIELNNEGAQALAKNS